MNHPIVLLLRFSWRYAKGKRLKFAIAQSFFIVANLLLLLEPALIGEMLNVIQQGGEGDAFFWQILWYLILILAIPFVFWALHGPARIWERNVAFHININYKRDLLKQTFSLPLSWHKDHHSGENIDKINRATRALFDFSQSLFEPVQAATKLIGAYVALLIIMPLSGLIAIGVSILAIASVILFDRVLVRQYKEIYLLENKVASTLHDFISNIVTVISMQLERTGIKEVIKKMNNVRPVFSRNAVLNEVKWFNISIIVALMIFGILVIHVYMTLKSGGVILVGTLYSLYAYLERVSTSFYNFAWLYGEIVERAASVEAAETITHAYQKIKKKSLQTLASNWKEIQIQELYFSHVDEKHHRHHVEGLNLIIRRGQKIALVGGSGGGKSTTMALLRGIQIASRVKVFVDGKLMPHGLSHLYQAITLIPQDPEVFSDTIRYNITMGKRIQTKEINRAIYMSRFDAVLPRLKQGLSTNIAEKGVNLSGGEKQRLTLARGLVKAKETDIVLMDEPTSSVDPKNEMQINERIFKEYPEKTIIASVHRLHLLRMFDYIYVIQEGKLVEEGSLKKLLTKKGFFSQMWKAYFKSHKNWEE